MSPPQLLILYGSQTGTAQEYAERIAHEAYLRDIPYEVHSMQSFAPALLPHHPLVLFLASTTGDGETPAAMQPFWNYLRRRELPSDWLATVKCSVMGLGDSSYEKFCWVGKRLARRLEQLGAVPLADRVDADEQHPLGLDGAFLPWIAEIWERLAKLHGWSATPVRPWEPAISLVEASAEGASAVNGRGGKEEWRFEGEFRCVRNERLTAAEHFQDVRSLVFVPQDGQTLPQFDPGDVAILRPQNPAADVQELIELLGWGERADLPYEIRPRRPEVAHKLPQPPVASIRSLLTRHLDITVPPRRAFFTLLGHLYGGAGAAPSDTPYGEKLTELASAHGLDLYLDYVWRPRRRPGEVLRDFPVRPPVEYVFDLFAPLRPREYSIASAWLALPRELQITAALVHYRTILPAARWGVCSRWLHGLLPGESTTTIAVRRGSWRIPATGPLLLLAAGTGIAPIRALIQHVSIAEPARPLYLFFGCRNLERDFCYRAEWTRHPQLTVRALGSRDDTSQRRHIDQLLQAHGALLRDLLLAQDASVFVAGNSRLPLLIRKTLAEICGDAQLPERLARAGKFQVEAWS